MGHVLGQGRNLARQQNIGDGIEKAQMFSTKETSWFQQKHRTGQYFNQDRVVLSSDLRQTASGEQVGQPKSYLGDDKVKGPSFSTEGTSRFQHKHRTGQCFNQPYVIPGSEMRKTAIGQKVGHRKCSAYVQKSWLEGGSYGDDELVKHMSNLPGFLQQAEKERSIQDRALNFGVLDWKRLEKWKYNERMPRKSSKKTSSSSNPINSITAPSKVRSSLSNQSTSHGCNYTSSYSGKQPLPPSSLFTSPPRQPSQPHSSHLNLVKEGRYASYSTEKESHVPDTSEGKEINNGELQAAQSCTHVRQQSCFDQSVHIKNRSSEANMQNSRIGDSRKERVLGNVVSSSVQGKHKFSINGKSDEMPSDVRGKFANERHPGDLPHSRSESCRFAESRISLDGQFVSEAGSRLYDFFCPQEFSPRELSADSRHSCPRPSTATFVTDCATEPRNSMTLKSLDLDNRAKKCLSLDSPISIVHEGKHSGKYKENSRSLSSVEILNRPKSSIAEQPVTRTASAPTHRFSFSLGRMSRSFNFKDSAELPQSNSGSASVKSGKTRPGDSSSMDNFERTKETGSSRARSSPLRRLLDPLLKHKGSETAEIVRPPNKSSSSVTVKTATRSSQERKPASGCQALLQLTLKNGRPCFKLVVDNSTDMLAAAVKRLPTSAMGDPCVIITLYSVHKIRKKGMHWIAHGLKSKNSTLVYDIVGQMKISNFHNLNENLREPGEIGARECVLYRISPGKGDKQELEFSSNGEVAAIIVKNSTIKLNDGERVGENIVYEETEPLHVSHVAFEMEEINESGGIVVILPGGNHGVPVKGAPSSLISRWRSGGLCDCGGWDVGCNLRVLGDNTKSNNNLKASISSTNVDLYVQGGELKTKPVFSLEHLGNGLYSIKLDASLSLLEAFAISVAHVTCQRFPELMDMGGESDTEVTAETITGTDERKFQEQFPAKNMSHPCPPLSPAGRI